LASTKNLHIVHRMLL